MSIKEVLRKKVPDFVKSSSEWVVFLRWVSQNDISGKAQLKSVLNAQIKDCEVSLKSNSKSSQGTNNRVLRPAAKKLDFLKYVKAKIVKYI